MNVQIYRDVSVQVGSNTISIQFHNIKFSFKFVAISNDAIQIQFQFNAITQYALFKFQINSNSVSSSTFFSP